MARFTVEDKLSAVKRYLEGVESYRTIAASLGTTDSLVRNWVKQYQHNGEEVLFKKSYTGYSAQFKLDVLNYMNDQGTSIRETAAIFNIPAPSTLLQWKKQAETKGLDALEPKKKGRPSMKNEKNQKKTMKPTESSIETSAYEWKLRI